MYLADVNVFVGAHRKEIAGHEQYRIWLEGQLSQPSPFGVSELILSAFLRIVTNHRVFADPTPVDLAVDFCEAVTGATCVIQIRPGTRHWPIFTTLCRQTPARGNLVPDAYLAALAIENGATLVTRDRGFASFRGVDLLDPFAPDPE